MTPEQTLQAYEGDVNAEENIRKAITGAYNDLLPELEAVRTYENSQFPAFYNQFNGYGAGTGAADMSPTAILQNAWADVANKSTTAQVARDVFDVRRASMEDLIKSAYNQWQTGYQGAQSAYDRWWAQKQFDEQVRQFNEQMARRGGSGGGGGITILDQGNGGGNTDERTRIYGAYQEAMRDMMPAGPNGQRFIGPMPAPGYQAGGTTTTPTNGYVTTGPNGTGVVGDPRFNFITRNF